MTRTAPKPAARRRSQCVEFEAFAVPHDEKSGRPVVHTTTRSNDITIHQRLSMDETQHMIGRLACALSALTLAPVLAEGFDPRETERIHRARLAVRLGLPHDDIRCVFDLSEADLAALVAEVSK